MKLTKDKIEVSWVGAVDEVVDGPAVGGRVDLLDSVFQSDARRKFSVRFNGERNCNLQQIRAFFAYFTDE
jgi:hypothetical protein